jgi:hypothetical protein
MIILHAAASDGQLVLWGEAPPGVPGKPSRKTKGRPAPARPARSRFAAEAERLVEAIAEVLPGFQAVLVEVLGTPVDHLVRTSERPGRTDADAVGKPSRWMDRGAARPGWPIEDPFGAVEVPREPATLPRRLGGFPFWRGDTPFLDALSPLYSAAWPRGLDVFLGPATEAGRSGSPRDP